MSQVAWIMAWLGATYRELGLAALLMALVLLAPVAPRIGEAIGARFGKRG